ncbi:hypothetical protein [Xanthocytophaga flava]|uniref:hypothetical protein n=1 Tax=Xanthocytophaga flava TaxID=3048013 RepID=UPI0028D69ADE|nr:hypothetical protein [Xanthocytophaga flavus]MDJ1472439.1 hypothetical protein [Xanthocytophaga flavus]
MGELEVISAKLNSYIDQAQTLTEEFNRSIQSANQFLSTKQQEFDVLSANQQTSNNLVQEIQGLLGEAKVKEANLTNILDNQTKRITEIETKQKEEQIHFEEYKKESKALSSELEEQITATTHTLNQVVDKLAEFKKLDEYLTTKRADIEKLAGFAADSSLGHSFEKRQKELTTSSYTWLIISIVLMVGTGIWLSLVYMNPLFKPNTGNIWLDVVLYAVKSAIAFVILGFAVRQYSRERSLQEEYAFKRAVAVTINAYADQLQGELDEDRRKLIMNTVEKMYLQPRIHSETSGGLLGLRSKETKELLVKVLDEVKELKNGKS